MTKKSLFTVLVFARLNTRRFFRDRLALFFGILFPLIFLFVFGSISGGSDGVSFRVAVINKSDSSIAKQYATQLEKNKVFKVDKTVTSEQAAKDKMSKSQLDSAIILPTDFGKITGSNPYPTGNASVIYTQNNATAGVTITSIIESTMKEINWHMVLSYSSSDLSHSAFPFTVVGRQLNEKSLTAFDYAFAGLLGFSIIGLGIFGPVNVFPELKKQGILRRLHTTPLRVWQYFLATMVSQAIIGLVSLAVMFAVALSVFHLNVVGNWLEIVAYLILSIIVILGIGLAIGGWAKNERQAAPLSNIVVFPMMFLSGTFFPRFLMPHWLQTGSDYLPLTPVIDGIRMLVTEGKHLTDLGPELGLLAVWVVVIYIIAFRLFRWE